MKSNTLKEKEKMFCLYYYRSRDPRWAAARAGYGPLARRNAEKLAAREEIQKELARLSSKETVTAEEIAAGYRRLAFGSVADALRLVCSDEPPSDEELESMELFNISEIKRPKGGGLEIKFFDRLKALEHMETMSSSAAEDAAMPFYMALERSAQAVRENVDE